MADLSEHRGKRNAAVSDLPARRDGLEVDEDRALQERFWRVERVVHGVFAVLVVLAILGLAGSGGPLANTAIEATAGTVAYPRIGRWDTPETMTVSFTTPADTHVLSIEGVVSAGIAIERITPDPAESLAGPDRLELHFAAAGSQGAGVRLELRAARPGLVRLRVRLDRGEALPLTIFILP